MTAIPAPVARAQFRRFASWVAVSHVGYAMFGDVHLQPFGSTSPFRLSDVDPQAVVVGFAFGAVSGAIVGTLQWLVLRGWAPRARGWIPATSVGFGLAHTLNDAVPYRALDLVLILVIGGVALGALQSTALRHAIAGPGRWIPVTALAWVTGWMTGSQVIAHIDRNPLAELFLGNGLTGLIVGAITGAALLAWIPVGGPDPDHSGTCPSTQP